MKNLMVSEKFIFLTAPTIRALLLMDLLTVKEGSFLKEAAFIKAKFDITSLKGKAS
jgi:hypothetical protein